MVWLSPVMIGYFALNVPAGLGLYWFVGNCVSIIQQSFVVGWGNILPRSSGPSSATAVEPKGGGGPKNGPNYRPRSNPGSGFKNGPAGGTQNGPRPKKPKK